MGSQTFWFDWFKIRLCVYSTRRTSEDGHVGAKVTPGASRLIVALKDDDDDVRAAVAEAALPARESLNPQILKKEEEGAGAVEVKKEEDEGGNLFEMFLETLWNA